MAVLGLQGCATHVSPYRDFFRGNAASAEDLPPLRVYLNTDFKYRASVACSESAHGCPHDANVFDPSQMLDAFRRHSSRLDFRFAPYEYRVKNGKCADLPDCDLEFRFLITHRENAFLEILAKLVAVGTLTLVPTPFFVTYDFELKILDRENKVIGEYRREERLTEWVQLGFLFFPTGHDRYSDSRRILADVIENMVDQIRAEGNIKRPAI